MNYIETLNKFEMVAGRKLALTTERSYRTWIIPFLKFLPSAEARAEVTSEARIEVFLSRMAREDYSAVAQNQAFNAILFLYRNVIKVELKDINALRCKRMKRERYTPTQPDVLQTAVKAAGKRAGITSRLTPHCLRHGFCSHLLDSGENIKRVAEAMGHSDIRTTAGYGRKECEAMASPLDRIVIPFRKTA